MVPGEGEKNDIKGMQFSCSCYLLNILLSGRSKGWRDSLLEASCCRKIQITIKKAKKEKVDQRGMGVQYYFSARGMKEGRM